MKKVFLSAMTLLLACCGSPANSSPVKVIVGAQLDPGHGQPVLEHSIIVVRDGKFEAVGPQQSTPVPKGAQITSGMGKLITGVGSSSLIATGEPANLILRNSATGSAEKIMHDGEWQK